MKPYQFRAKIIDDVRTGRLSAGEYIGTASELSMKYSMPVITLNRILSGLASEGLVKRIKNRGTFVADVIHCRKRLRIGLAFSLPQVYKSFQQFHLAAFQIFPEFAKQCLRELGFDFLEFSFEELHKPDFDFGKKLDGLLVNAGMIDENTVANLMNKSYPIVAIQHNIPSVYPFHQVIPDLMASFIQAIAVIRENGVQEVTLLYPKSETHIERMEVFRHAALCQNFPSNALHEITTEWLPGDLGQLAGYKLGLQALKNHHPGKTYFSVSDIVSCGILGAFFEKKMQPGKDFQLISFDNLEADQPCFFAKPTLSSIDFPKKEIIRRAIQLIETETAAPSGEKYVIKIPCALIERETFCRQQKKQKDAHCLQSAVPT